MSDIQIIGKIIIGIMVAVCDMSIWLFLLKPKCKRYIVCLGEFTIVMCSKILPIISIKNNQMLLSVILLALTVMSYTLVLVFAEGGKIKNLLKYEIYGNVFVMVQMFFGGIFTQTVIPTESEQIRDVSDLILYVIINGLIIASGAAAGFFMVRWMLPKESESDSIIKYILSLINIYLLTGVMGLNINWFSAQYHRDHLQFAIITSGIIVIELIIVRTIFRAIDRHNIRKEKAKLSKIISTHYEYYKQLEELEDNDEDYVNTLRPMIDEEAFIPDKYRIETNIQSTNSKIIDTLFHFQGSICRNENISLEVVSCDMTTLGISEDAIVTVFGYIINNAVSVNKDVQQEKYIKVRIEEVNKNIIIIAESAKPQKYNPNKLGYFGNKEDKRLNRNNYNIITNILKAYNGVIEMINEEMNFSVNIVMPIRKG